MDTLNKEELHQIKRNNIEVRFVPFVDGYSTTNIVNQINNEVNN
jgi:bifunctional ADP-heptose synthase (sugar kinase/adenylyltransferase)